MRALAIIFALFIAWKVDAQSGSKSIFKAIKIYENELGITFSFDAELLLLANGSESFTHSNIDQFIAELESHYPLKVEIIDQEYYTISASERTYSLIVKDSLNDTAIEEDFGVQLIVNDAPIQTFYEDGQWKFQYRPDVNHSVVVFSQGYKKGTIDIDNLFNNQELEIYLGLPTTNLGTVVVEDYLTKGINLLPSKQQIQIDVNDLPLLPGETDGDIFASIAALPGITNPDGRAGNIFIRGSETDQTLILFDNIPVYHRGHYYGTISPYNPKIVNNVEVYRSGFHPKLGDRVGGAIIINAEEGFEHSNYGIGANTLFGMVYGKHRFNDKWSATFGIRNSYPRSFKSPKLKEISESVFAATSLVGRGGILTQRLDVGFRDLNGKVTFDANEDNSISISSIYTISDINFMPVAPPDLPQRSNDNRYENTGINLSWKSDWNQSWSSEFYSTYSYYDFEFTINTLAPGVLPYNSDNSITDFNAVQNFSKNGKYSNLEFGIDYKWQKVATDYRNSLTDSTIYTFNKAVSSSTIAPYINLEYYGLDKWYLQFGLRSSYYSALDELNISPRVLINYDLSSGLTLKSSLGWYNQFLSQVKNLEYSSGGFDNELWTLADKESGFVIDGLQSMLGAVISSNKWIFDFEAFYKTANDITIYEGRRLGPNEDFYTMDQETYGIDVLLKKQVSEATSLWTGYSYHDSKITIDTTDEVSYKSKFVQPHVWYLGGTYKKARWKFSASWRYASGLYARSLDIAFAESIFRERSPQGPPPPNGAPPPPNPFADLPERYPSVQSLDISVSYKIPPTENRKWSASFGLSLLNTLNQTNLTDRVFRSRDGFVDRDAIGFAPNLMVIIEW